MRAAAEVAGPLVPVVVAARDVQSEAELTADDLRVVRMPERYAPPDAPTEPAQAVGLRTGGAVAAGSPITTGVIGVDGDAMPGALRRGERALELAVAGDGPLLERARPGGRVDVLVSTEPGDGPAHTSVALEDVELIGLRPGAGGADSPIDPAIDPAVPTALATLRVTARQAVHLVAAQAFARELRLLPRPRGDRRQVGRLTVTAEGL
jgi:pilus assembly protein CpaB